MSSTFASSTLATLIRIQYLESLQIQFHREALNIWKENSTQKYFIFHGSSSALILELHLRVLQAAKCLFEIVFIQLGYFIKDKDHQHQHNYLPFASSIIYFLINQKKFQRRKWTQHKRFFFFLYSRLGELIFFLFKIRWTLLLKFANICHLASNGQNGW